MFQIFFRVKKEHSAINKYFTLSLVALVRKKMHSGLHSVPRQRHCEGLQNLSLPDLEFGRAGYAYGESPKLCLVWKEVHHTE